MTSTVEYQQQKTLCNRRLFGYMAVVSLIVPAKLGFLVRNVKPPRSHLRPQFEFVGTIPVTNGCRRWAYRVLVVEIG